MITNLHSLPKCVHKVVVHKIQILLKQYQLIICGNGLAALVPWYRIKQVVSTVAYYMQFIHVQEYNK